MSFYLKRAKTKTKESCWYIPKIYPKGQKWIYKLNSGIDVQQISASVFSSIPFMLSNRDDIFSHFDGSTSLKLQMAEYVTETKGFTEIKKKIILIYLS